jgi:cation transport ATPase
LGVRQETLEKQTAYFDLERVQTARKDQTVQGVSAFGAAYDVSTTGGALLAVPIGFVYLLFAPFPWAISGLRQLLTLPETLVWYALMPSLVRGLRYAVRHRLRDMLPILAFAGTLTLAYSVFQSNVGTAYRQRTQVNMFFFILIGAGLELKRGGLKPDEPVPPTLPTHTSPP